jgi:hypothetical protein
MSIHTDLSRLSLGEFAERFRNEMIPLSNKFSYFYAALPLTEDDIREYLEEPIAALPPDVVAALPQVYILLVPYLERGNGGKGQNKPVEQYISVEKPPDNRFLLSGELIRENEAILAFSMKDQEVADYHYQFYRMIATLLSRYWSEEAQSQYFSLLREELISNVHGEVDEDSWHFKQTLLRRQTNVRRETKVFREYAQHSFIDTMTLYLHGICCDIDVETGPRQLPSRYLRRRLDLLQSLYPPPEGYAVFPEDLNNLK